jgi:uncharacterized membrane protein YhdT
MYRKQEPVSVGMSFAVLLVLASAIALEKGIVTHPKWFKMLWITIPLLVICLFYKRNKRFNT